MTRHDLVRRLGSRERVRVVLRTSLTRSGNRDQASHAFTCPRWDRVTDTGNKVPLHRFSQGWWERHFTHFKMLL